LRLFLLFLLVRLIGSLLLSVLGGVLLLLVMLDTTRHGAGRSHHDGCAGNPANQSTPATSHHHVVFSFNALCT